jgi:hypothetical protein
MGEICRALGSWRRAYIASGIEYGGLKSDQARRLKDLEAENAQLKRAVAGLAPARQVLAEAAEGSFSIRGAWRSP